MADPTWLVFANGQSVPARRFATAVDRHAGYPRTEPGRVPAQTETHCTIRRHSDGRTAIKIDDFVRARLGQVVQVNDGGLRTVTITLTGADRTEVASLDGWPTTVGASNPWVPRPPRDGLP